MMSLAVLPFDVLDKIFSNLNARDFLSVVSTCKLLYGNRHDSGFWRRAAQQTFRVRNRPSVEEDGKLWMRLYRRLLTQTRVAYWGQSRNRHERENAHNPIGFLRRTPGEVVADLQCGGWSTAILNNRGEIAISGDINGLLIREESEDNGTYMDLLFPMTEEEERDFLELRSRFKAPANDSRRIRQFSTGRSHILGLADDGTLWSWFYKWKPGVRLEFPDLFENDGPKPSISYTVAGWRKSSIYIRGVGIVVWDPVLDPEHAYSDDTAISITRSTPLWIVPGSSFMRADNRRKKQPDNKTELSPQTQGEVKNHILLEHFAIFVTDTGRIFASRLDSERTFELPELQAISDSDPAPSATDVQGSFRSFAVFKRNGELINSNQTYLEVCEEREEHMIDGLPSLLKIPALQNTGVISVAFGDYHWHALHSDGRITSYGKDPQCIEALGLATRSTNALRGVTVSHGWGDGTLLPHAYFRGRQIWFHPMQHKWLYHLAKCNPEPMSPNAWGEISEWIEQMGSDWHKRPSVVERDEDGLGPYFALSVAAGGWRSGAIVLVNENPRRRNHRQLQIRSGPGNAYLGE